MSSMSLGAYEIQRNKEIIEKKIALWRRIFPNLNNVEFVNGRAKLGEMPAVDSETVNQYIFNGASCRDFCLCLQEYCKKNDYIKIKRHGSYGFIENTKSAYDLDYDMFISNEVHFIKEVYNKKTNEREEKFVKVKTSKVLSATHELWVAGNLPYKKICSEIKRLRAEGKGFEDNEVCCLTEDKKFFEKESLWCAYNNMLNQVKGQQGIYLSLNPFDKFTSAGTGYSDDNPTMFDSCWGTRIKEDYDGEVEIRSYGCYSNPASMYRLANILNAGLIYIPNGKTLSRGGIEFIGYKERSHIWLDEGSAWLEQMYPNRNSSRLREVVNILSPYIPCETKLEHNDRSGEIFSYQDYSGNENYCEGEGGIFLDTVYFGSDYNLYKLPEPRIDMGYDSPDMHPDGEDYTECAYCDNRTHDEDNFIYIEDVGYVCEECYRDRYYACDDCGEIHDREDIYWVDGGENGFCSSCINDHADECHHCEEYHSHEDMYTVTNSYGEEVRVCYDCRHDYYTRCNHCGHYEHDNIIQYAEDTGKAYCESCIEKVAKECCECSMYYEHTVDTDEGHMCTGCANSHTEEDNDEEDNDKEEVS